MKDPFEPLKNIAQEAVEEWGNLWVDKAAARMDQHSPGRTYRLPEIAHNFYHTASRPFDAPNNMIGDLRDSLDWEPRGPLAIEARAGSEQVDYATRLEKGSKNVAPRPNYEISAQLTRPELEKYLDIKVKKMGI